MDEEPMEATAEELVHHHHQQQQHVGPTRMVARGQEMAGGPQLTSSSIGDEKQGLMPSSQHPHHHQHPHNHPCQSPDDETTTNQSVNQRNPTTTTITNNSNLTPTSPTTNIQQADPNGSQDSRKSTGVPLLRPGNMGKVKSTFIFCNLIENYIFDDRLSVTLMVKVKKKKSTNKKHYIYF